MSVRKRVRRFLNAPSIHPDPKPNELLHRRWESGGGGAAYDLRVSDLRELLRQLDASRAEVRTLTKLALAKVRAELQLQMQVADLQQENTDLRNTVSELSKKIGGHERWAELRQKNTSLAAQRDQLQLQNAGLWRTVRELRENLARAEKEK